MRLNVERTFPSLLEWAQLLVLTRVVRSYEPYQPVRAHGRELAKGERQCTDRWRLLRAHLEQWKSRSLLDLGCAEGYFVRAAAEHGCFALGVDADIRRLSVARAAASLDKIRGAGFIYADLSPPFLASLPSVDAVLFLSVLHHIMYEHGLEYARTMMAEVRRLTRHFLLFDMGQSNERHHEWSAMLPDMGPDPSIWIASFLVDCGFSTVEPIAMTDAYKNQVN